MGKGEATERIKGKAGERREKKEEEKEGKEKNCD